MTTFQKLKHEARRAEQRSDWERAIGLYQQALDLDEDMADLSLYNRIGDLHLRLGRSDEAVACYELAVERYADNGMHTSAIALCNKILRIAPERVSVYRRLGRLNARTGLVADGRTNVMTYVRKSLETDDAGDARAAVDEFAELSGDDEVHLRFADLLVERGDTAAAVEQLRQVLRAKTGRGEDGGDIKARILELAPDSEWDDAGAETGDDASAPAASTGGPVRLADLVAEHRRDDPGGFDPEPPAGPVETPPSDPGLDGVRRECARFRDAVRETIDGEDATVRYDLGVEFMTIGLLDEAMREFQVAVADPRLLEAANARIGECIALRDAGTAFAGIDVRADERADVAAAQAEDVAAAQIADVAAAQAEDAVAQAGDAAVDEVDPAGTGVTDAAAEAASEAVSEADAEVNTDAEANAYAEAVGDAEVNADAEADPAPAESDAAPVAAPDAEGAHDEEVQGHFFKARLAQYRIRRAEERHSTDHAAHLDLGLAYVGMELYQEALRELGVALQGARPVAGRAMRVVRKLALAAATPPELALAAIELLASRGAGSAAETVGTELARSWGQDHPMAERLVALRSRLWGVDDALPALEDLFPAMGEVDDPADVTPHANGAAPAANGASPASGAGSADVESGVSTPEPGVPAGSPAGANGESDPADPGADGEPSAVDRALSGAEELIAQGEGDAAAEHLYTAFALLEGERRVHEAVKVLNRLLELRPDDAMLHHQRTELALMTNDRDMLLAAHEGLGACLRRRGDDAGARAAYGRMLDLDPDHQIARDAVRAIDEAELERERTHDPEGGAVDPRQPGAADASAGQLTEDESAELDELLAGLEASSDDEIEIVSGDEANPPSGLEDDGEPGHPDDHEDDDPAARSRFELGLAFRQMGMWEEAARELLPALDGISDRVTALEALGECLVKSGRPERAIDLLGGRLRSDDDGAQVGALYFLGLAFQTEGRDAEAKDVFERIEAVRPGYRDAADRLSELSL